MKRAEAPVTRLVAKPNPTTGELFSVAESPAVIPEEDRESPVMMSDEVRGLVHEQALYEYDLHKNGRRPERIKELSGRKFGPQWVRLALQKHDITGAMPPFSDEPKETAVPTAPVAAPVEQETIERGERAYRDWRSAAANDRD